MRIEVRVQSAEVKTAKAAKSARVDLECGSRAAAFSSGSDASGYPKRRLSQPQSKGGIRGGCFRLYKARLSHIMEYGV